MTSRKVEIGTLKISDKAKKYVNQVLDENRLSYGDFSRKFEQLFAKKHDSKFAIVTNSGTSALHVALAALKIKYNWSDGDEVLVPATTFVATINVIIHNNLKPVLVDVDPIYYELDETLLESKITARTRAIIPVHLFGLPCNMTEICSIAKKHDLKIIEDSCECMLATHKECTVGSFGDIGCFSTYIAHLLTTGVGGVCTTSDSELAVLLRSLNNHGRDSIYISIDDDNDRDEKTLKEIVSKRFSFVHLGHSFRLTEMEWAIGLAQLEDELATIIEKRKKNASYLTTNLLQKNVGSYINVPKQRDSTTHSFMIYPITVIDPDIRTELINFLEVNNIETRDLLPIVNQPVYKKHSFFESKDYPIAEQLTKTGFYIGCHQDLTREDLDYVVDKFEEFFA